MSYIKTEKHGRIMHIIFDRPDERNAFNTQMVIDLSEAYTELEKDEEIWCGIIRSSSRHFTVGLELGDIVENVRKNGRLPMPEGNIDPWGLVGEIKQTPVIVAADGMCLTLGIELMLASEISLGTPKTMFSQMETARGIYPIGGGTMRWVDRAGYGNAMRYLLTSDMFNAEQALQFGIIQEIVSRDKLLERANEFAERICKMAPLGVRATVESAQIYKRQGHQAAVDAIQPRILEILESEDADEGVRSLQEKRDANFKGK